jgi:hypothetical protein
VANGFDREPEVEGGIRHDQVRSRDSPPEQIKDVLQGEVRIEPRISVASPDKRTKCSDAASPAQRTAAP